MPNTKLEFTERAEVQYLMGNPPSWMLRYGITFIGILLVILLIMAYCIRYPDIQTARAYVTTRNPPIRLLAPANGKIAQFMARDRQQVSAGDLVGIFESAARWQDVLSLEEMLQKPMAQWTVQNLQLGVLQEPYSTLMQHWKEYGYLAGQPTTHARTGNIRQQIASLQRMNEGLMRQKQIQEQELQLARSEMERQNRLFQDGVISKTEQERANAAYLQQQRQVELIQSSFVSNDMEIKRLEGQSIDMQQTNNDQMNIRSLAIEEDIKRLRASIDEWKKNYLLIAPIDGQLSFSKVWSAFQTVTAGDEIAAIVPPDTSASLLVKALLPVANSAKVSIGMKANLRLDGYPHQEYGILHGRVSTIALLPQDDFYHVEISLNNALTTSFGKTLELRHEMQGSVRIITEDRRIIDRIFGRFKGLLST
jgi:multidrug resistance efflux pump